METKSWKSIKGEVYGVEGTSRRDQLECEASSFSIGLLLRKVRVDKHLTHEQLGEFVDKIRAYISRVENSGSNLTLKTLYDIVLRKINMYKFCAFILIFISLSCTDGKKKSLESMNERVASVVVNGIDLNQKLNRRTIRNLDSGKLRLLRNEIFAKSGYKFKSKELDAFFKKFEWYLPQYNQLEIESEFSEVEIINISLIQEVECDLEEKKSFEIKKKEIYKKLKYSDYIIALPNILLPSDFDCSSGFRTSGSKSRNDTIIKFKPDGAGVVGKFYVSENEVSILYTYPADIVFPIVEYYDLEGNKKGSRKLFKLRECVSDFGYSAFTKGRIEADFLVSTETTIIECNLESDDKDCDTTSYSNRFSLR